MYTIESIEENIVKLEDRNNKTFKYIEKNLLPKNIKEGDILEYKNNEYILNEKLTKEKKEEIRNRFNSLMN